jgi:thiamine biosynthesis protein ThiI
MPVILIRYDELALKSPKVRRRFQNKLISNIQNSFLENNTECIIDSIWGRIFVHTKNLENGIVILKKIFGISSFSIAEVGTGGLDDIIESAVVYADEKIKHNITFAIRSRRFGKHDFTSMEVSEKLGAAVLERFKERNIKVNLSKPDVSIFVEVRNDKYYFFSDKIYGVGGFPLGTQGKILGIYENPDSFLAWWLMMKRGAEVVPIYPVPQQTKSTENSGEIIEDEEFKDNFEKLRRWSPDLKIRFYQKSLEDERFVLYSKIVNDLADQYHSGGIVTGMKITEFENELKHIDAKVEELYKYPIFFPLIGLSPDDLEELRTTVLN